jgi:single-strand DNA-binding protein
MAGLLRFPNINNVTITGRLVRDVELKHSANGVTVARLCIAVSKYFRDENGNFQEQASFVDIVAFNKQAQICQECLKKGSPVLVQGELKTRTYTDQHNQNRKITEIIVDRVYPLEKDENFVSNYQAYTGTNNNSLPPHSANQQQQVGKNVDPEFSSYEANYGDINTENDVPF